MLSIGDVSERTGIAVESDLAGDLPKLRDGYPIAVFRVFQDALMDAAEQPGVGWIAVSLARTGPDLVLEIKDDRDRAAQRQSRVLARRDERPAALPREAARHGELIASLR